MNALDALKIAQDVGVRVRIDGEDLVLEALAAPPPTVIDLLSRYKVSILQKLREVAIDTAPVVPAFENPQESFSFTPPETLPMTMRRYWSGWQSWWSLAWMRPPPFRKRVGMLTGSGAGAAFYATPSAFWMHRYRSGRICLPSTEKRLSGVTET